MHDTQYVVNFKERKSDLCINEFATYKVYSKEAASLPSEPLFLLSP